MPENLGKIIKNTAKMAITIPAALLVFPIGLIVGGPSGHTGGFAYAFIMAVAAVACILLVGGFGLSLIMNLFGIPWFITFPAIYLGICLWYALHQK